MSRRGAWDDWVPFEMDLEPMTGVRPLDTYSGDYDPARHRHDCPCGHNIPEGHRLVCLVCHRSGFDRILVPAGLRSLAKGEPHDVKRDELAIRRYGRDGAA